MKSFSKYIKVIALVVTISITTSCEKFLEEDPKNFVAETNYYSTEADAIAAVNSIYAYLNSINSGNTAGVYHSNFWVAIGLASDEMFSEQAGGADLEQLESFSYIPQNSTLFDIWEKHYKTITIANIAIARISGINMNETLKARLLNEAKFLRGLMYFNLVRMFGDIPLLTQENETLYPSASPKEDIYNLIIQDLTAAEALPPSYDTDKGRATKWAAKALLGKVYLTRKDWPKAAPKLLEVVNSGHALWDDFADAFKLANKNGKESVFSVEFGDAGGKIIFWEVGQFLVRLLPPQLSEEGVVNAQGWQLPTQQLYNSFDIDDRRRAVTFITEIHNKNGTTTTIRPYIQKYWDREKEPTGNATAASFPVIRYSDVLLMYAEALNELDNPDAHTYINMVRKRARFDGTTYRNAVPDYSGLNKVDLRAAILKERRLEFVAEGHRWFDLVRTGTLETLVPLAKPGIVPASRYYLFPIPQQERDVNPNLPQNLNY
ncbi:MAG: RagB/SusD family nutrient uptake outer membrane protein [Sphingobacteriaceae bacterium]